MRNIGIRRAIAGVAAAALAVGLAACAPAAEVIDLGIDQVDAALPDDVRAQLQAATETAMSATGSPGAIVGVYAPWAGEWVAGLGTTSPEGSAVSADMTIRATAATRSMTCDVLYALVENGTVGVDDAVSEWTDSYPNVKDITLGQLCDGTSGIGEYTDSILARVLATPERVWTAGELAAYGLSKERAFDAGTQFAPSDTGYVLLGIVLERVTGMSLPQLYTKYVFEPLGMSNSRYGATALTDHALGGFYSVRSDDGSLNCASPRDLTALSPSVGAGATGVESTVEDLAIYARALASSARPYDTEDRFADARPAGANQPSWFTADGGAFQAGTLIGQHGSMPGAMTAVYADRETGLAVVVSLSNSRASSAVVRLLAWQLAAIASKAPAADGRTAPESGLPWTAESLAGQIGDLAICS
ncbi:serine hydrolase domain-containing protein [Microbacterium dauci]|uniref:Serine hydrolase domain-containing protein n=1 Tax=Microbacterium dauci TaxID=3048008 RepID=A0ABT6ZDF1_9MICO|nr:serine hydrolase domain-containing protein [Microbacterium sp. LX3-4]MDJ1114187.1 serine hydrolase domain-containing protein [Microbacterium sp. LX3-4]